MKRNPGGAYDQPLEIDIYDGEVVILGPGAHGLALTASAAAQSAQRLAEAASQACAAWPADGQLACSD